MSTWIFAIALACAVWYFAMLVVQGVGLIQLYRYYSSKPKPPISPRFKLDDVPHITIVRPVKGLEPQLYECLAATFRQDYPLRKLTIYFCVASADDPAYPVLRHLLADFPKFDAKLFIEEEDGGAIHLGPNPKIRNMSRAYREAKGDVIWIIDCNVWVGKGVAGRMVDKLCGFNVDGSRSVPYKFVHQLPLVVDGVGDSTREEARGLLRTENGNGRQVCTTGSSADCISSPTRNEPTASRVIQTGGGRLEEMFMATSHAKFYTAINTVSVAPCIVGKSNMFRRSHLDFLTSSSSRYSPGIDFFSENICEDHLIGDLLWRKKVPGQAMGERWYNHGLVFGDVAIQPMARMSVRDYVGRRIRWLRVRKWTVPMATLVEPGVEPLLCSAYGSFAITTLPWFHNQFGVPHTWLAFVLIWLASVTLWMIADSLVYSKLHSGSSIEVDEDTPSFALPPRGGSRRPLREWIAAWVGREILALPVWSWACLGGTTVVWRGKKFRVNLDMKVVEIKHRRKIVAPELERPRL